MSDLVVHGQVTKTGSSTLRALLIAAATRVHTSSVATTNNTGLANWLCLRGVLALNPPDFQRHCPDDSEVVMGSHQAYGSGHVIRPAHTLRRGLRLLTTLREPLDRSVSEYTYMCLRCQDQGRFCHPHVGHARCPNQTSFVEWIRYAPNQFTRQFARYWLANSYFQSHTRGFAGHPRATSRDVDQAFKTLSNPRSYVLWTDTLQGVQQRETLARLRAWLGGKAAKALAHVHSFPRVNALPSSSRYAPSAAERREACQILWADCELYARLRPNRTCDC